ncbi:hypothetical protein D3C84_362940 [compost metagenome]
MLECLDLDLPHPFAGQAELLADRLQRATVVATQTEMAHHDLALLGAETRQPLVDAMRQLLILRQLAGVFAVFGAQGVEQGRRRIGMEHGIRRADPLTQRQYALDLLQRFGQQPGDVLGSRFMLEPAGQQMGGVQIAVEPLGDMDRQADGAGLTHDGPFDVLTDPPGGVGRKTATQLRIELAHRTDQPEITLLDQVQQQQATVDVTSGNPHHQAQIALDHALARQRIAPLRQTREVQLLFRAEQRTETDFTQIQLGRSQRPLAGDRFALLP